MSRDATALSSVGTPGSPRIPTPSARTALLLVLGVEILLLAATWRLGAPGLPLALALVPVFFFLAFRSPDTAWALLWIGAPFSIQAMLPGGNAVQVPTEPLIPVALAGWLARCALTPGSRLGSSPLHWPLAVAAGIALLSAMLGSYPWIGLKAWIATAGYVAFGFLYFSTTAWDAARRERWTRLVVGSGAFWGLYGLVRVLMLGVSARAGYGAARPFFPEHGTYSAFLAMLLPLAVTAALARTGRARAWYAAGAISILLGIVFSFTRAAWISLAVILPLVLGAWVVRHRSWRPLAAAGALLVITAAVLVGSGTIDPFSRHAQSVTDPENVSNLERLNRWVAAIEMTKDRPVLGVGYGAYAASYPAYRRKLIITEMAYQYMGPHSEPLRLLSEMGIAGFLAALWMLGVAAWLGLRAAGSADRHASAVTLGVLAGLGTYVIHGVFNTYLGIDKVAVPFWSGLGVLAALARDRA